MSRIKIIIRVMFFLLSALTLTACTGKETLSFSLEEQGGAQEAEYVPDAGERLYESETPEEKPADEKSVDEEQPEEEPVVIYVHICGAVVSPGVYELDEGSRVFEGIRAAGGFREDASTDYVNQAQILCDGQRLTIPTLEEVEAAKESGLYKEPWENGMDTEASVGSGSSGTENADGRININTADESELSSIDGIGAGKAAAIVKYRQEHGSFQSIQDIMNVSGIKEGTYEKIKEKITVK